MNSRLLGATAALALMVGVGTASAQTVTFTPDQDAAVHAYVTENAIAPATIAGSEVTVGSTLPGEVELHEFDGVDGMEDYRFVVVDSGTYIVDPDDRRVVHMVNEPATSAGSEAAAAPGSNDPASETTN